MVYAGERPFRCKICDMSFTTNGNMHRHARIHEKEGHSMATSHAHSAAASSAATASSQPREHTVSVRRLFAG